VRVLFILVAVPVVSSNLCFFFSSGYSRSVATLIGLLSPVYCEVARLLSAFFILWFPLLSRLQTKTVQSQPDSDALPRSLIFDSGNPLVFFAELEVAFLFLAVDVHLLRY